MHAGRLERALGKVWQYFNSDRAPLGTCGHLDDNLIRRRLVDMERQLAPEERGEAQELIREAQLPVWGGEPGRRRGLDDAARARLRELGERSAAAYQAQASGCPRASPCEPAAREFRPVTARLRPTVPSICKAATSSSRCSG